MTLLAKLFTEGVINAEQFVSQATDLLPSDDDICENITTNSTQTEEDYQVPLSSNMSHTTTSATKPTNDTDWTDIIDYMGDTYTIAPADYQAKTGVTLTRWTKAQSDGRFILRNNQPLYWVNDSERNRGTKNVFVKGCYLRIWNGRIEYKNVSKNGIDTIRPIIYDNINWCVGTGRKS